jgi:hypothetical protein
MRSDGSPSTPARSHRSTDEREHTARPCRVAVPRGRHAAPLAGHPGRSGIHPPGQPRKPGHRGHRHPTAARLPAGLTLALVSRRYSVCRDAQHLRHIRERISLSRAWIRPPMPSSCSVGPAGTRCWWASSCWSSCPSKPSRPGMCSSCRSWRTRSRSTSSTASS